jgi:HlyD family secretion protein
VSDEDVRLAQIAVSQAQARLTMDLAVSLAAVEAARASVQMTQAGKEAAQAALTQAEASLEAAQGGVELAEASVTAAQGQVEVARGQLAQAEAQRDRLKAGVTAEELAILQAQVTQAEAALAQAESALARATLVAPFAGTVSEVHARVGQTVMPGQTLVDLGDLSTLRAVTTDLSERDVVRVAAAQEATVFVEALNIEIPGWVAGIAPEATTVGGDVVYEVVIELAEQPPELRWGMSVEVEIDTR